MSAQIIIGIDPGISGGLGIINPVTNMVQLFATPTVWVKRAGQRRQEYNLMLLTLRLMGLQHDGIRLAVVERGGTRPGQHAGAVFGTGFGCGLWLGLLTGLRIPFKWVQPAVWKKHHGLIHADKKASRLLVQERWPELGHVGAAAEGAAEGLLMASYIVSKEGFHYGTTETGERAIRLPAECGATSDVP